MPASPTKFSEFPGELRSEIWTLAAFAQIKHIADDLPRKFSCDSAERRRQAFIGQDRIPLKEVKPLMLSIRDPYDFRGMRLEEDGFEAFVNCLPMSAVCREARYYAARVCRTYVTHMALSYCPLDQGTLGAPEEDAQTILLRDAHCSPPAETLEHVFARPTIVTVYGERRRIKSPAHLVQILSCFFGSQVKRLILELVARGGEADEPFWADATKEYKKYYEFDPIHDVEDHKDPYIIFLTPDRKLHAVEEVWDKAGFHARNVAGYLDKLYEIVDVCRESQPHLEQIDLNLEIQGQDHFWIRVKSNYHDGVLSADLNEAETDPPPTDYVNNDW